MTRRTTLLLRLLAMPLLLVVLTLTLSSSSHAATGYSQYLRRYPYLTDVVDSYATINWGTDQSNTTGGVRYGQVGSESCTAHYVPATARTVVKVNMIPEYQWSAMLNLQPGTQYCYRVYLGSGPATEVDLLGTDASPVFWTQVPSGSTQSYTFDVFGDWGGVDSTGANPYMAKLMSLMASSGARFAVTVGDNGYPSGSQTNYGDLVQSGADISAIFGPSFWKVPGASLPLFPASGNHGLSNADPNHPIILNWPQTRAVALSNGRYVKETYCCLDGTTSANYPSAWYAFDAGLARIYVLDASWADTNIGTASSPYQVDYDYHWTPTSPEYQWLQADLASHPSTVKLAMWHYPLYTDDPHQPTDTYLQGSAGLEGLLKQYGVQVGFDGHSHTYERNAASSVGFPNYVTGGGGTPLPLGSLGTCTSLDLYAIGYTSKGYSCGTRAPTTPDPVYHFLKVTVSSTSITVTPVNSLGSTFDVKSYSVASSGDTTAPSIPSGLAATPAGSGTEIDLTWSASTDNKAVRGYDIYRNGTLITQTDASVLSYADTAVIPAAPYTYTVDAFDGSGNHSAQSAAVALSAPTNATYIFNPVADSYVAADNPTVNYGTSSVFKADGSPDYHSYLRFNVNEIAGTVTKATLSLYTTYSSSIGYQVSTVSNNQWDEGTVTYANAPALGALVGSSGKFSSGNWVNVDVTSLVTGNGIYDLGVSTTSTSSMSFNSRDAADSQPRLIIQTTATPPTPTATATATLPPTATPTATLVPTATPTLATASLNFSPSDDATLNQGSSTTNYGSATTLSLSSKPAQDFMLKFNVSGTSGLPIVSAKLRLYGLVSSGKGGDVHQVADTSWTEGTVTWSSAPAYNSAVVASYGSISANAWAEVDVSSLVKGDGTYSFRVVNTFQKGASYSSKEGSFAPQLVINYFVVPTATSVPAATATSTATATATLAPSATPTNTALPTNTPTDTPVPSDTPTQAVLPTDTPFVVLPSDTPTPTNTPTDTPLPTDTPTLDPLATPTDTPLPTDTPTLAPVPTDTPTLGPVPTNTPTATSASTLTPTPGSTPVFSDGFESGALSKWTTTAGLIVESGNVHSGGFAAEGNTTVGNTYAKKLFATTYTDGYARIYFNIVSYASQVNLLRYRTAADGSLDYLFVSTAGKLSLRNDVGLVTTTSATSVPLGWHSLELHTTINGTASSTEVWMDGVKINDLSLSNINLGTTPIGKIQIGEVQSARTYDVIFDDVVFDTQRVGP